MTLPSTIQGSSLSTRSLLLGIWGHLSRRRRLQFCLLLVVMLASGVAEMLSLGAVLPFMAVLSDPQLLWQDQIVQEVSIKIGITSANELLLPVTLLFSFVVGFASFVRLTNLWLNGRLAAAVGSDLSLEAYRLTLYQPYEVHLRRNSASVITGTTTQIGLTTASLSHLLQLITSTVVASGLLIGLLVIDAPIAITAAALIGAAYGVLAMTARLQLLSNGRKIAEASSQQLKVLQEGLGAIRDVLLDGRQPAYLKMYRQADVPLRRLSARNGFLASFPRFALEAIVMIGIAFLGGFLVLERGSGAAVIPLLGALALGAQRLLPALQQVYSSWCALTSFNAAMESVLAMLNQPMPRQVKTTHLLGLHESICLDSIQFSYGQNQPKVLKGVNLEIRRGERIGFIGSTGSGKSTMVDVLMGLLSPTLGRLLVDEVDVNDPDYPERLAAWRASIAHVPQSIYLADSSIAENIAFGVPIQFIDLELVKQSAAQAQIASFIATCPEGYNTFVGERGVRLSGGQRQRIGIARALYKQSNVIVLDEATSALDASTEMSVMESLEGLSRKLTVLMIAHRLSTLRLCDRVVRLENGLITAQGPPSEILTDF